jgi:phosphatidylinositol glycan class M
VARLLTARYPFPQPEHKALVGLVAFLPQLLLLAAFTLAFHRDLAFCVTAITTVFVVFNKVCTVQVRRPPPNPCPEAAVPTWPGAGRAQYFVWYFCLLPLVLPASGASPRRGALLFAAWATAQAAWLAAAGLLELHGYNTFLWIWLAGIAFFAANIACLVTLVQNHRYTKAFDGGELAPFAPPHPAPLPPPPLQPPPPAHVCESCGLSCPPAKCKHT